ncbi:MAG: CRISPR-associated RAMP protein Csx7 [Candidatus Bathyarchaeia archaeon]
MNRLKGGERMVFEKLQERILLLGKLEAVTPLHIGSGRPEVEVGEVDMPILRDPAGQPYIPGSSLKGRTRAEAERIARAKGMEVCNPPNVKTMCGTRKRSVEEFCIVCRIFGTAGSISVASKVRFRDAYPTVRVEQLLERTGIAIDRTLGTVMGRALYTIEAVPAGTTFNLEIVAENLTDEELKLLLASLKSVEDSALGGSSTRGFGKVRMWLEKTHIRSAKYYLGEEEERVLEGEGLRGWLREKGGF